VIVAVTFYTFALAVHIAAIVIAFGVTFAYPVMYSVGARLEPRSMPGFHRIQDAVGKRVISPFLGLALLGGSTWRASSKCGATSTCSGASS
jgi:hypothetical protein